MTAAVPDLHDIEDTWKQRDRQTARPGERTYRLIGWVLFTVVLVICWVAAWSGWGASLGRGLQNLYGVPLQEASWWLRSDTHLHLVIGSLVTVWGAWTGRLFTPVGSWLGPPITILVVIIDEVVQIGEVGRSFQWEDMAAGVLGMILAMMVILAVSRPSTVR